ncbi:putative mitochondrial protein [Vitis vinifera]|uniref:Putative mitochondrial protein n=1 Tax=Vitis vinifera TaxID=29760 RepID=A0A438C7D7_VITVI|nr:putative mitochondrial protein [Vitis vinifera]
MKMKMETWLIQQMKKMGKATNVGAPHFTKARALDAPCASGSRTTLRLVLVTGSAKGWVKVSRGLRQGDPLSHFLFTLVADILSMMLLRAEERNLLEVSGWVERTRVTHLQFADDTIFFSNTREEDLQTLKSLLLVFGHISGLKVNLDKSNIYGINLDQIIFQDWLRCLIARLLIGLYSIWVFLWEGTPRRVAFGISD